ncbi:MAG: response regulator [Roseiflexaceae bacterium]
MSKLPARILVVDDEAAIRSTLEALLHRQGYAVWTAVNGAEAFAWLCQAAFDLLVIDLLLPGGVSGLDIALAARMSQSDAAVLILTGSSELADAVGDRSVHHYATMLKTASPQEVLARVAALIAQQHALPQRSNA